MITRHPSSPRTALVLARPRIDPQPWIRPFAPTDSSMTASASSFDLAAPGKLPGRGPGQVNPHPRA
jgi:hypothetical protein